MAKSQRNEAKIKFTAETKEFNESLKKASNELSNLKNELKVNDAQMRTNGQSVEALEKQHSLLQNQLLASQDKTQALSQKLDKAVEIFGAGSTEVKSLKTQLSNAQVEEEKIKQAIDRCNKSLKDQSEAAKKSKTATAQLTDTIDKQQSELDGLKGEYKEAVLQYGKTSKEAKSVAKQIDALSKELDENQKELSRAEKAADEFDNSLDDAGNKAEKVGEKMKGVAVGVGALTASVVAAGKSAIDAFNEVDEGADNVIKATGATGKEAKELEQSYKNVASSIVGDFGDIGSALGEVNTRFGFTGTDAEKATTKFLQFSEVTGMDATEAVKAVSRAIESAGLESSEYGSILDSLTAVGQSTGISVDTLATSLTDYGASLRGMGYDTNESIAMLAQFEKAGVDSNAVIRGMRMAQAAWAKDGKNSQKEFARLVKGIKEGSVSAGEAYEVFGSKAGGELVDAIKSGRFSYEDMIAVVEGSKGTLETTFDGTVDGGYKLDLAMQNAKLAMADAGETVSTALIPALEWFSDDVLPAVSDGFAKTVEGVKDAVNWMKEHKGVVIAVASVIGVLTGAIAAYNVVQGIKAAMDAAQVTTIWGLVAAHWAQATAAMAAIAPYILIVAAIAAVIAIIVLCVKHWDKIKEAGAKAWEGIKNAWNKAGEWFKGVWNGIKDAFANVKQWFSEKFTAAKQGVQNAWASVKGWFSNVWAGVKNVFSNVRGWFMEKFNAAKLGVQNAWSGIKNFFRGIKDGIVNAFSNVKEKLTAPFTKARDTIKGVANKIKGFFKGEISMPKIKLPHFSISPSGWKVGDLLKGVKPKLGIEWYADGGIMTKPTIFGFNGNNAMVGGEGGAEAILPIDRLQGYIANTIERYAPQVDLRSLVDKVEDLANRPVVLKINDKEFARATAGASDSVNGQRSNLKARGLEI